MRKICFVVQRYGLEVNGGAELMCRQMAEHLIGKFDVEVLTTKAIDYITWKNEYSNDVENINGVIVRRFGVIHSRVIDSAYSALSTQALEENPTVENGEEWMVKQGPNCPALIEYLKDHSDDFDVFVFVTYLYYTTYFGLPVVADKALFIPTVHEETPAHQPIFKKLFDTAQYYYFNTQEEYCLAKNLYAPFNGFTNKGKGGVGVDLPETISPHLVKQKYGLENYVIYVGRIDVEKDCSWLFKYFIEYKIRNRNSLKLVLMGKTFMEIPEHPDIINLGFVSDEDKFNGIAGARCLINPSSHESLSIVVLEAMALGVPVLVNSDCDVLKGHCIRSNAGLYYHGYFEFEGMLNYLLDNEADSEIMGKNGKRYVEQNYTWEVITERFSSMIDAVIASD